MPTPKKKKSRSRRDMRRSHDHLTPSNPGTCPNCSALMRPHTVCKSCGTYKGRQVLQARA